MNETVAFICINGQTATAAWLPNQMTNQKTINCGAVRATDYFHWRMRSVWWRREGSSPGCTENAVFRLPVFHSCLFAYLLCCVNLARAPVILPIFGPYSPVNILDPIVARRPLFPINRSECDRKPVGRYVPASSVVHNFVTDVTR